MLATGVEMRAPEPAFWNAYFCLRIGLMNELPDRVRELRAGSVGAWLASFSRLIVMSLRKSDSDTSRPSCDEFG